MLSEELEHFWVSSVLRRDVKSYGKDYMLDNQFDTCWSSDAHSPQWIKLAFKKKKTITSFSIQFQGGFAGKDSVLQYEIENGTEEFVFYPTDTNDMQYFALPNPVITSKVKFIFKTSTDCFGRIIIYNLKVQFKE